MERSVGRVGLEKRKVREDAVWNAQEKRERRVVEWRDV